MRKFKKLILGALLASALLVSIPSQEAKAATIEFSPPAKEFYFLQPFGSDSWFYTENPEFDEAGHLVNAERAITYLSFDVSGSVFENPSYSSLGNLVLSIHDVVTSSYGADSQVDLYRVNDQDVYDAGPAPDTRNTGEGVPPIDLGAHLGQGTVNDLMEDGDIINIAIQNAISSGLANGNPYLSFAITGADNSLTYLNTSEGSFTSIPAPEPMPISYILLGCCAFLLRKVKHIASGLFGLA
jgi:hypothetical protein